jgi:hypothetical protein
VREKTGDTSDTKSSALKRSVNSPQADANLHEGDAVAATDIKSKNPRRRLKLGRYRPVARGRRLSLKNYLKKIAVPAPPPSADYSAAAMPELDDIYLNDQLGDCVIAAGYHMVAVATGNANGSPFDATSTQLVGDYSAIGGYDPNAPPDPNGNNPTDQGCDEVTAMNYWCEKGFADKAVAAGWVEVDATNQQELEQAIYLFEHVFLTLELPDAYYGPNGQNAPTQSGFTWDAAGPSNPNDGHAIVGVGYNGSGVKIDTWSMLGTMTWAAAGKYCVLPGGGAYVMLTPDIITQATQKAPNGLDWGALVADLNAMGANIPVITSPKSVTAAVNSPTIYKTTATNNPVAYFAENLPVGLTVNKTTGLISGKPTTVGTVQTTVGASNKGQEGSSNGGSGVQIVTFTITSAPTPTQKPVITSPGAANATVGKAFNYKITATNNPTSYGAVGLPAGLTVKASTGVISGTPTASGTMHITVSASNSAGKGTKSVKLVVSKPTPPVTTKPPVTKPPVTKPPVTKPPVTKPPRSSSIPPSSSIPVTSGIPPTSGVSMRYPSAWPPPPTYTLPPIPPAPPVPAAPGLPLGDLGRQLLGSIQGSRKLGIVAASGIVIQGLLSIVSMTDDGSDASRR